MYIFQCYFQPCIPSQILMCKDNGTFHGALSCLGRYDVCLEKSLFFYGRHGDIVYLYGQRFDDDMYTSPIQGWIERACEGTCHAWQELLIVDDVLSLFDHDHMCSLVIAETHVLLMMYCNGMLRWLHWLYDYI